MPISVCPILAKVERPNPRKISPMPQTAKLTTKRPMTAAMTTRPNQFVDACRKPRSIADAPLLNGVAGSCGAGPPKGAHHREAAPAPQLNGDPRGSTLACPLLL